MPEADVVYGASGSVSIVLSEFKILLDMCFMCHAENNDNRAGPKSLVDLARILVYRRYFFFVPFLIMLVIGSFFVFSREPVYEYVSYYSAGLLERGRYIEQPKEIVFKVNEVDFPEVADLLEEEANARVDFQVIAQNPEGAAIVKLLTMAPTHKGSLVREIHNKVLAQIDKRQRRIVSNELAGLKVELASINGTIDELSDDVSSGFQLVSLMTRKAELQRRIEAVMPGQRVVTARVSQNPVGISRIILVFGIVVFAVALGLFVAYGAEFVSIVRRSVQDAGSASSDRC